MLPSTVLSVILEAARPGLPAYAPHSYFLVITLPSHVNLPKLPLRPQCRAPDPLPAARQKSPPQPPKSYKSLAIASGASKLALLGLTTSLLLCHWTLPLARVLALSQDTSNNGAQRAALIHSATGGRPGLGACLLQHCETLAKGLEVVLQRILNRQGILASFANYGRLQPTSLPHCIYVRSVFSLHDILEVTSRQAARAHLQEWLTCHSRPPSRSWTLLTTLLRLTKDESCTEANT